MISQRLIALALAVGFAAAVPISAQMSLVITSVPGGQGGTQFQVQPRWTEARLVAADMLCEAKSGQTWVTQSSATGLVAANNNTTMQSLGINLPVGTYRASASNRTVGPAPNTFIAARTAYINFTKNANGSITVLP